MSPHPDDIISPARSTWVVSAMTLLHILLALMFVVVLAIATDRAHARDTTCQAANLLERMAVEAPDQLDKIRRDADGIANGKGLLWRIDTDGTEPSFLYGTMHLSDPRILALSEAASRAFGQSDTVIVELKDLENIARLQAAMFANPALTMLEPGQELRSLMTEEDWATVSSALEARGIPLAMLSKMKPWLIFSLLVIPDCETQRRLGGAQPLDAHLAGEAVAGGKRLEGLETIDEQLSALSNLSLEIQVRMLVDVVGMDVSMDDRIETMIQLYIKGETGMIMSAMLINAQEAGMSDSGDYAEFEENLIGDRNHRMADRLKPYLAEGNAFIAVGALHLPGEDGLVELLRDQGFRVTAVP